MREPLAIDEEFFFLKIFFIDVGNCSLSFVLVCKQKLPSPCLRVALFELQCEERR